VSPVKYELGFHIPEDGILHSQGDCFRLLIAEISLASWSYTLLYGCYSLLAACTEINTWIDRVVKGRWMGFIPLRGEALRMRVTESVDEAGR
jgi:hypothetical protein